MKAITFGIVALFVSIAQPLWAQNGLSLDPPEVGVVYIVINGKMIPTERSPVTTVATSKASDTTVAGDRAGLRIEADPTIEFVIKVAAGVSPSSLGLFKLASI